MPNPKPKGGRPMVKGETRNPKGSSAKARNVGKIRALTAAQVAEIGSLILTGTRDDLTAVGADPGAPFIQVWFAGLAIKSLQKGDASIFKAILDRIVGKPKESVEVTGAAGGALNISMAHAEMSIAEREARADALAAARKEVGDD